MKSLQNKIPPSIKQKAKMKQSKPAIRQRRKSKKSREVNDTAKEQEDEKKSRSKFEFRTEKKQVIALHILTVFLRLWVVSDKSSWWILHPDEVYQSIEVAHSEVYGYGFVPYEFLPPPRTDNRTHLSRADRQEAALGMYSMRSYVYPSVFMVVFHLCQKIGIRTSPVMIAKLFHAFISSHLSLAVYCFTVVIRRSHEAAILAAILATFSEHLTTFGTHTIICSFLAPFVFGVLALQFRWIYEKNENTDKNAGIKIVGDFNDKDRTNLSKPKYTTGMVTSDWHNEVNGCHISKMNGHCNGNLILSSNQHNNTNGELPGNHTSEVSSHRIANSSIRLKVSRFLRELNPSLIGFTMSALCYIRPDLSVHFMVINATHLDSMKLLKFISNFRVYMGSLMAVLLLGYSDRVVYGGWFMSPMQWIKFNVFSKTSGLLFGEESGTWYVCKILNSSVLFQGQLIIVTLGLSVVAFQVLLSKKPQATNGPTINMLLTVVSLFTVYSIKGHKEMRFLHNTFVCFNILSALVVCDFTKTSSSHNRSKKDNGSTFKLSLLMLTILLATHSYRHQNFGANIPDSQQDWLYKEASDSGHVNICLDFIGRQKDATGLFLDYCIHTTMGFSIIHKDIPLLTLVHDEFYEFDKSVKRLLTSNDILRQRRKISVHTFSNPANFITRENYPFLLKYLLQNPAYNYVIYGSSLSAELFGYEEVFSSGPFKVFKRQDNPRIDALLTQVSRELTKSLNSTILTYEGNWLLTFEQYQKAAERLRLACDIEVTPSVKTFQLLYVAYLRLGDKQRASETYKKCIELHGAACNQPQANIRLRHYDQVEAVNILKKSIESEPR